MIILTPIIIAVLFLAGLGAGAILTGPSRPVSKKKPKSDVILPSMLDKPKRRKKSKS